MAGDFEVVVVHGEFSLDTQLPGEGQVVSSSGTTMAALLNTGAAAAKGDVLFFLWPDTQQLSPDALTAIERNFHLLPQSIGGNFHIKFDDASRYTKLLVKLLKRRRYQGRYYGNSGVFVRRDVFEALGGFQPYSILEDYEFARRLEKYGPTLYLPETIVASARKFKSNKFKATVIWLAIHTFFSLGLCPSWLVRLWEKM